MWQRRVTIRYVDLNMAIQNQDIAWYAIFFFTVHRWNRRHLSDSFIGWHLNVLLRLFFLTIRSWTAQFSGPRLFSPAFCRFCCFLMMQNVYLFIITFCIVDSQILRSLILRRLCKLNSILIVIKLNARLFICCFSIHRRTHTHRNAHPFILLCCAVGGCAVFFFLAFPLLLLFVCVICTHPSQCTMLCF